MPETVPHLTVLLATDKEAEYFPLYYQIACILLTGLFLWSFSVARDPRGWRRLFQAKVASRKTNFSVNRNKKIDEALKRWGIIIAMMFLVVDVTCFVFGLTYHIRMKQHEQTTDEKAKMIDVQQMKANGPTEAA